MAWLSRNNFTASDYVHADDLNNLANDLRTWGGDVNGGGHTLANVVLSGSGGFQYYPSPVQITPPAAGGSAVTQYSQTVGTAPSQSQVARWTTGSDGTAETGANAGSNFAVRRFSDAGAVLGTALSINRATGNVGLGVAPASQLQVFGSAGPAAPVLGGGTLYLQDSGTGVGNGGSVLFGAAQGYWAGIKGSLGNGGANTAGDLVFYTRINPNDTSLTERMRLATNGGVGIGIGTPTYLVHVQAAAGGPPSSVYHSGGVNFGIDVPGNAELVVAWMAAAPYGYWIQCRGVSNNALPISLNPIGGNVGIGTNTPSAPLDVVSSSGGLALRLHGASASANDTQLRFYGTNAAADLWAIGTDIASANGSKDLQFYDMLVGLPRVTLRQGTGFVGIGTTAPTSKLQVVGLPIFASDGAAGTGGLTSGAFYIDASGGLHAKL